MMAVPTNGPELLLAGGPYIPDLHKLYFWIFSTLGDGPKNSRIRVNGNFDEKMLI